MSINPLELVRRGIAPPAAAQRIPMALPTVQPRRALQYVPPDQRVGRKINVGDVIHGSGPRSIRDQIGGALSGVLLGAPKLAMTVGRSAAGPVRAAVDLAKGDVSPQQVLRLANHQFSTPGDVAAVRKYDPLSMQLAESGGATAGRLSHPARYKQASDEGRIVDVLLEDIGNISLASGLGAGALGEGAKAAELAGNTGRAEALGRLSTGVERVSKLGGQTADLPISIPRKALQYGGRKFVQGAEAARAGRFGEGLQGLAMRAPELTTESGRFLKSSITGLGRSGERAGTAVNRKMFRAAEGVDIAEQGAVTAVRTGIADQYRQLVDSGIDPEQARTMIVGRDVPEQTFTPDVARVAYDYLSGKVDPEVRARMDRYAATVDEVQGVSTDRALQGVGRTKPMDERYQGSEAIPEYVDQAVKAEGYTMDTVPAALLNDILDNPMVYPAAWRPSMVAAGKARALGETVPLRPAEQLAAGLPKPAYLPGGRSNVASPTTVRAGKQVLRAGIDGIRGIGSEQMRVASEVQPFSARTIAEKVGGEARDTTINAGLKRIMNDPRVKSVSDVLTPGRLDELRARAHQDALTMRGSPGQQALAEQSRFGEYVHDELAKVGFEALPGNRAEPAVGDFNPGKPAQFHEIGADTVALPVGMRDKLTKVLAPKDLNLFLKGLEKINSKFKGLVLPFSVRWQLGDTVGGMYMAAVGGGVAPWQMIDSMRQVRQLDDTAMRQIFDRPEFQDAGLSFEENQWMHGNPDRARSKTAVGRAWHKGGNLRQTSFKVNSWINRTNRQSYVLAKVQKLLDERGLSLDATSPTADWSNPAVQSAIDDAVADANRVMGTFDEMTPFERRVVRNVFPFYAWSRHITQLAFRTAIDNPQRMMWTMHLGTYGADPTKQELPWMKGSFQVGQDLFSTSFVNPFNDVANQNMFTSLDGAIRATSPGLKIAAGVAGYDANNGLALNSRPYNGKGLDLLGREGRQWASPLEAAYIVARQFPQTRTALTLAPTGEVAGIGLGPHPRFDQGSLMVDKHGQPFATDSRWQSAAGLLGLPWGTSVHDAQAILTKAAQRQAAAKKKAANTVRYGNG